MSRSGWSAGRRGLVEGVILAVALVWSVSLLSVRDTSIAQSLSNVGLWLAALSAGVAAVRRGLRHVAADRRFWLLLGAAMISWSLGQAVWTW